MWEIFFANFDLVMKLYYISGIKFKKHWENCLWAFVCVIVFRKYCLVWARYGLIAICTAPIVPQNFASPLSLMSPVYYSGLCKNEYHIVKKLAKSFPEVFFKIIFRFTSQKFSLPTSQSVEQRGEGGGGVGNSHISYKSDVMLVVSLRDWMNLREIFT